MKVNDDINKNSGDFLMIKPNKMVQIKKDKNKKNKKKQSSEAEDDS